MSYNGKKRDLVYIHPCNHMKILPLSKVSFHWFEPKIWPLNSHSNSVAWSMLKNLYHIKLIVLFVNEEKIPGAILPHTSIKL